MGAPQQSPPESGIAQVLPAGSISRKTGIATRRAYNLLAPMRDGTHLALDLIRPDADAAYPVVLVRTPYDKTREHDKPFLRSLAERGYVVAIQDTRGRFNSDGSFFPYRDDRADGDDVIAVGVERDGARKALMSVSERPDHLSQGA